MIKVYFVKSQTEKRLIAEVNTIEEVWAEINKFMQERNYKSYYQRLMKTDSGTRVDVGSWTQFFDIEGITFEELCEYDRENK